MGDGTKFLFGLAVFAAFWAIMLLVIWLVPENALQWSVIVYGLILLAAMPLALFQAFRRK